MDTATLLPTPDTGVEAVSKLIPLKQLIPLMHNVSVHSAVTPEEKDDRAVIDVSKDVDGNTLEEFMLAIYDVLRANPDADTVLVEFPGAYRYYSASLGAIMAAWAGFGRTIAIHLVDSAYKHKQDKGYPYRKFASEHGPDGISALMLLQIADVFTKLVQP